jgi:hypothetical protein
MSLHGIAICLNENEVIRQLRSGECREDKMSAGNQLVYNWLAQKLATRFFFHQPTINHVVQAHLYF